MERYCAYEKNDKVEGMLKTKALPTIKGFIWEEALYIYHKQL